jgi:hypothetical protein
MSFSKNPWRRREFSRHPFPQSPHFFIQDFFVHYLDLPADQKMYAVCTPFMRRMNMACARNTYRPIKKTWLVTPANRFAELESKSGKAFL